MSQSDQQSIRPTKKWKIYTIHHSHTDIGYTERQEVIEQYHVDFIRQALQIVEAGHRGEQSTWNNFRWTCETFWAVERFLESATAEEKAAFEQAIKRGQIELSGTYLNMTELPDHELLHYIHGLAQRYAHTFGHQIDSAMTADINGYSWGYADSLLQNGIQHLFSCIHTHHGMFPLGRKQIPFWWETPAGERLLVWNGDHYMIGNELGICPHALGRYMIKDELMHTHIETEERHLEIARTRMHRYLWKLEQEGYPYDFVPVMVSGLGTDNASPNARIAEWIAQWNEEHGEEIEVVQTTLSAFFARLKQEDLSVLPVHRGDWPDWWTDGTASTPMHTQIFRDAQRTLRKVRRLDPKQQIISDQAIDAVIKSLAMYAEHTWGYHTSVGQPWHPQVQMLEVRKQAYAAQASTQAHRALDQVLKSRNGALLYPERPLRFEIINTEPGRTTQQVTLQLDGWEPAFMKDGFKVMNESTGEELTYQLPNPQDIVIELTLEPNEAHIVQIIPLSQAEGKLAQGHMLTTSNTMLVGADGVYDIQDLFGLDAPDQPIRVSEHGIASKWLSIRWQTGKGIHSWIDKTLNQELLDLHCEHGAFTPIYELTPAQDPNNNIQVWAARARMGRNRKGINVQRDVGRLSRVRILEQGPLYTTVELQYEVKGISHYALFIKMFSNQPRVEVSVRLHKDSVWMPENVYVALPFTAGTASNLYVEKSGAAVRPWKDQIPGTCIDYYSIQEGMFWLNQQTQSGLALSITDTPMVQLGPLEYGQRLLHTQQPESLKPSPYAWLMTNYWETNFKATLGGFYEFRYALDCLYHEDACESRALHALHASTGRFTVHRVN